MSPHGPIGTFSPSAKTRRLALFGMTALGAIVGVYVVFLRSSTATDARAYFDAAGPGMYGSSGPGAIGAYLYSPAFSQAIEPLRMLGWDAFRTVLRLAQLAALTFLAGPVTLIALFVYPIVIEMNVVNIHLFMAVVIVAGFRWPAVWSFILLTKVTPGIGLLWFVVRREWMSLGIALGATAAIALVSAAIFGPSLWFDWIALLFQSTRKDAGWTALDLPLAVRVPAAAAIVVWGARTSRRWTVPVAAMFALPVLWWMNAPAMLLAIAPLLSSRRLADRA